MIANIIHAIDQIVTNPSVRNGRPFIVGTTITVADIAVAKTFSMMEAEEIAEHFRLSLPQVYSALAFYYDHKAEIDRSIEERRRLADEMKEKRVGSRQAVAARIEEVEWSNAALAYTMQRMDEEEGEDAPTYSLDDLKERYQ